MPNLVTKPAGGSAGGASRGGPGGRSPRREDLNDQSTRLTPQTKSATLLRPQSRFEFLKPMSA
eukprot:5832721-Alexandrium_andersonii.AAC.1